MNEEYKNFKDESDILEACDELFKIEPKLDRILAEICTLQRGHVLSSDTLRRAKTGSHVSAVVQQIHNFVDKNNITLKNELRIKLRAVGGKADKVLRENIVLQTKPPLDVIKFKDVPVRHSYSSFGGREQRWGYGLHKKPFNEEGDSVTVADMPPHYIQSVHNHTVSEYCLIIGSKTEGIYYPGKKREKIYSTKKSEIFHFSATTPHMLKNTSDKNFINMTFKHSMGLLD